MGTQKARPSVVAVNLLARPGAAPSRSVPVEDFPRPVLAREASTGRHQGCDDRDDRLSATYRAQTGPAPGSRSGRGIGA